MTENHEIHAQILALRASLMVAVNAIGALSRGLNARELLVFLDDLRDVAACALPLSGPDEVVLARQGAICALFDCTETNCCIGDQPSS